MGKYRTPRNDGSPSNRKFRGFGFYIQSNGKLSRTNRQVLLKRSEEELGLIEKGLRKMGWDTEKLINNGIGGELDPKTTDLEMLDIWNRHYDEYGYMMSEEFSSLWIKESEKQVDNPKNKTSRSFEELLERIELLEKRVSELENIGILKKGMNQKIDF